MISALDKLEKILRLEQERGYRDTAVIGGLARFADAWREQAHREKAGEAWVAEVAKHMETYSQLATRDERQAKLEKLRTMLQAAQVGQRAPVASTVVEPASGPVRPDRGKGREPSRVKAEDIGLDSPVNVLSGIGPTRPGVWLVWEYAPSAICSTFFPAATMTLVPSRRLTSWNMVKRSP